MSDLFHISLNWDDSPLKIKFSAIEVKLDRHERQINELFDLLSRKPDKSDLDQIRDDLSNQFNDKMKAIERQFDEKIKAVENKLMEHIDNKIMGSSRDSNELNEINDRLRLVETIAHQNEKEIFQNKQHLQAMVSAYADINQTKASLDGTLPKILKSTTNYIQDQFDSLNDSISFLQSQLAPKVKERSIPVQEVPQTIIQQISGTEINLSHIHPRLSITCSWQDRPKITMPNQFEKVEDSVDYIYTIMPQIQAYLDAMHDKIVENAAAIGELVDKETLNKLLTKMREAIRQMDQDIRDMHLNVGDGLTRDEVLDMIEANAHDSEGAVGSVKCIACGREMTQVSGAMRETDAIKKLGSPVNSLVLEGINYTSSMYSNTQGMERGICESPRSLRPFRASVSVTKKHRPRPPQYE